MRIYQKNDSVDVKYNKIHNFPLTKLKNAL